MSFGTGPFGTTPFGATGGTGSTAIATQYPIKMFIPGQGLPTVHLTGTAVTADQKAAIQALADKAEVTIIDYVGEVADPFGDTIPATRGWVTEQIRAMIESEDFVVRGTWRFLIPPQTS